MSAGGICLPPLVRPFFRASGVLHGCAAQASELWVRTIVIYKFTIVMNGVIDVDNYQAQTEVAMGRQTG